MTRMTREFTLLLLGSGLLTSGYFLWRSRILILGTKSKLRHEWEARSGVGLDTSCSSAIMAHLVRSVVPAVRRRWRAFREGAWARSEAGLAEEPDRVQVRA